MGMKKLGLAVAVAAAVFSAQQTLAQNAGDISVRVGATTVDPQESSSDVALNGTALNLAGDTTGLGLDSNTQLGLTLEYALDSNWSIEVLAATPFSHTAAATGELANLLNGLDVADTKHLPPTVSAIYRFGSGNADVQPYVGAGLNYTVFFSEDTTTDADAAFAGLGLTGGSVDIDDSFGLALQAGVDFKLNDKWSINTSVRWIDIDTEATITFDSGDKVSADIDIDPMVYSVMVGYKF
ncbi:MAG: outer membrane beta-barrel protein [Cellvibrionaceae bacterium]